MDLDLVVKDPIVRGALALFPVFSDAPAAPAYLTGPAAEAAGVLAVSEQGEGVVPELSVTNTGTVPVLLVEGETLLGAKQNRTLNVTVLLPAAGTTPVPVSCVEAGRWGTPRAAARSRRHAPGDLRRVKTEGVNRARRARGVAFSDQGAVWERIARYEDAHQVASATSALEDVYGAVEDDMTAMVDELAPLPDQRGVVVAVGGTVRGIDCFDKASTLAEYWDGLVQGYAFDALGVSGDGVSIAAAERFVARVLGADDTPAPTVGLGTGSVIGAASSAPSGIAGHALEWDDAVVHLAAFATDDEPPPTGPTRRRSPRIDRTRWFE